MDRQLRNTFTQGETTFIEGGRRAGQGFVEDTKPDRFGDRYQDLRELGDLNA
jgi:hypothetical protein